MDTHYICGIWKFNTADVALQELNDLVQDWALDDDYTYLFIRKLDRGQIGIGFTRKYDGTKEMQDTYREVTEEELKEQFAHGLLGWDMAGGVVAIKGF